MPVRHQEQQHMFEKGIVWCIIVMGPFDYLAKINISPFADIHRHIHVHDLLVKRAWDSWTHLFEGKARGVSEITALSPKQWMRFISNYKHDVWRNFAFRLIAFLLKCDFGARLPSRLHRYAHILVLFFRRAIWLQHASRYFHLFHTTTVNFLERHVQIMFNRRVLNLLFLERCVHVEWMWPKTEQFEIDGECKKARNVAQPLQIAIIKFHVVWPPKSPSTRFNPHNSILISQSHVNSPKCCSEAMWWPSQAEWRWKEIVIDTAHRRKQVIVMVENVVGVKERTERIACSEEWLERRPRISVELVGEVWAVVCCSIWSICGLRRNVN